jgi:hypothetical protein
VQGLIAVVGFTTAFDIRIGREIVAAIQSAGPRPAGEILTDAVAQARRSVCITAIFRCSSVSSARWSPGRLRWVKSSGLQQDLRHRARSPAVQKYGRAFVLTVGAGSGLALAFLIFALGRQSDTANSFLRRPGRGCAGRSGCSWQWSRSPRCCASRPVRRQPAWSWLLFGAAACVTGWVVVTVGLGVALNLSSSFGKTYGPLAGIVALQLWTLFSAIAIFYGAAVAAQLEAVRAGSPQPRAQADESRPRAKTSYAS